MVALAKQGKSSKNNMVNGTFFSISGLYHIKGIFMNKNKLKIWAFFLVLMASLPHLSLGSTGNQNFQGCNTDKSICIKIIPTKPFNSAEDSSFRAEFLDPKNKVQEVKKFSLFMPMHGQMPDHSAPPVLWAKTSDKPLSFFISEADFYMTGDWLVRVDFRINSEMNNGPATQEISVPVKVLQ